MNKEIKKTLLKLQNGDVIVYPTDTVWGIGCDATNEIAVAKIYDIKQREESKSLIILVDSLEMLSNYVENVSTKALEVIETSEKPTTIIYTNPQRLAKNVIAKNNTIAIRIVQDAFCKKLIHKLGKPIVSTSANISEEPTPKSFQEINTSILDAVDYVVNLHQNKITNSPSAIIKIDHKGKLKFIRE